MRNKIEQNPNKTYELSKKCLDSSKRIEENWKKITSLESKVKQLEMNNNIDKFVLPLTKIEVKVSEV